VLDEKQSASKNPVIPALLATSAAHRFLIKKSLRTKCNLIVNSASARDTHQVACLIGFGATCVHPWLGLQCILKVASKNKSTRASNELCATYRKSLNNGLLKIMSKMGISNVSSYRGACLFEVIGFSKEVNDLCFPTNNTLIFGDSFNDIHNKNLKVIDSSFDDNFVANGLHKYVHDGERHAFQPDVVMNLQNSLKRGSFEDFKGFTSLVNQRKPLAIRDFFDLSSNRKPIDIANTEDESQILRRFDSAGMSLGSLSPLAHETLAAAMNQLGCRSNSGE
jgi:glutamate synthase (NADPH/NADH) large chain